MTTLRTYLLEHPALVWALGFRIKPNEPDEAGYFLNNHKRMDYLFLREEHFPIGSGTIESGIKQFKTRFCGPGMRWSRPGAQYMLALRSAVLSDYFHLDWYLIHNSPPP